MTIMHSVFAALEEKKISYCHFKSNQHLKESFEGRSDFDVLVDFNKVRETTSLLLEIGAKRFESPCINNYPGIENWLVFDEKTGIIYHLHLHYQLLTGTPHVKEYRIFWQEELLKNAVKSKEHGIMTSDPEREMLLLLTRLVLKCVGKKLLKARLGGYKLSADMKREFDYLLGLIKPEKALSIAKGFYSQKTVDVIDRILKKGQLKGRDYLCLRKNILKEFTLYRRCGRTAAFFESKRQTFISLWSAFWKKRGGFYVHKKVSEKGGMSIAFIGVDGSGKSSTTKEIFGWLKNKVDCKQLYLGSGDGKCGLYADILKLMLKAAKMPIKLFKGDKKLKDIIENKTVISFWQHPFIYNLRMARARLVAQVVKRNRIQLKKMNAYRTNGGVCLMDRFPQLSEPDMNDGPKLGSYAETMKGAGIRALAKKELDNLQIVKDVYPDVIFRLNIDLETCIGRKPEHANQVSVLKKKLKAMENISYPGSEIVEIDATRPYQEELLAIKREIWKRL